LPIYLLGQDHHFPDPGRSHGSGLLAVGGDLDPDRLLVAYRRGIFPWYSEGDPILWYSPDPRFVLLPPAFRVPRSLRQTFRRRPYDLRVDTAFSDVITACGLVPRPGQGGTWITPGMLSAYTELHRRGWAHSFEAWRDGQLVGGLYGVSIGDVFFGESMFARAGDASKVAFVAAAAQLWRWGIQLLDSQVYTDHVSRFGAVEVPRRKYLELLAPLVVRPTRVGTWNWDAAGPYGALEGATDGGASPEE
jgi:leucyl/phenylalanyl-tRNA--protein transferase